MKAYDFQYDNHYLHEFGMIICSFDKLGLDTVSNGSIITFNTTPSLNGSIHRLTSTIYEDCLEATIQICKYSCSSDIKEITQVELRELTRWLNRKKFLKFKPISEDYIDLYFEASFNINRIELDGKLYGLELEVITNRPFALKEPQTIDIATRKMYVWEQYNAINEDEKGERTGIFVTSYDRNKYPDDGVIIYSNTGIKSNYYYVYIEEKNVASINDISHEEGYIYPHTEITIGDINNLPIGERNLKIYNEIENRETCIANVSSGEIITMDYPIIQSSIDSHHIQNDFNWIFFRIANTYDNSRNDLTFSLPCTMKIKYSPIVKVGL